MRVGLRRAKGLWLAVVWTLVASAHGQATALRRAAGVAYDSAGNLFVADPAANQVLELTLGGALVVVAGTGVQGFSGDGGLATAAQLNEPMAVAVGADNTLYIADTGNERIRAVQAGQMSTLVGTGARGFAGDGGPAKAAALNRPVALALDSSGALLVCDQGNQRVRRVSGGQISTIAGTGVQGFAGDGGPAASAELNQPAGVVVGADGRVFIADTGNQRVRVVSTAGTISTLAGTGLAGAAGDGGAASAAQLSRPAGLAFDGSGALLVADQNNRRVRRIASDGRISTVAGNGSQGLAGDAVGALSSAQNSVTAAAVGPFGWVMLGDAADGSLRMLLADGKLYDPLATRVTTTSAATPSAVYGSAQAIVSVAGNPGVPLGAVQVSEGGATVASAALTQGAAVVALPQMGAGTHNLTVSYGGDGLHRASLMTSTIQVAPAPVVVSATNATVSYGAPLPMLSGTTSGVLPQDASKVATVFSAGTTVSSPVGTYPIAATLSGAASANYSVSMAPGSGALTIVPAATIATMSAPSTAYETLPLQMSVRVASSTTGVPTGTVQFFDGGTLVATAPLVNGLASAVELNAGSGGHTLSAAYSGDGNFRGSTSSSVLETVNAMPDFGLSTAGSSQQTVLAGSSAVYHLTVGSQGAPFTGAVMLSASGLPAGAKASFSPPAVVPGASSAAVTMTVTTTSMSARGASTRIYVAFMFGLLFVAARRKRVPRLMALFLVTGAIGLSGCGARVASEAVMPAKSYSIQVQATGTNLAGNVVVHTVNVSLMVE